MVKKKVMFGGWYQRTTLHLTEVHIFLTEGRSKLKLNETKLKIFRKNLGLKKVERIIGSLEYLRITTNQGLEIKYYEDGLYVIEEESEDVAGAKEKISKYYNEKWKPAIDYVFSLGAPTPKILSNMGDDHPFVILIKSNNPEKSNVPGEYGKPYKESSSPRIKVSFTPGNIFIHYSASKQREIQTLTNMQIFFYEFKAQLQKYLDIHRKIWEEISDIKEKKEIKGKDVDEYRAKLESYRKTITLIKYRMNQMGAYAKTRATISENLGLNKRLVNLYQYRFEDLFNTLDYIKEIWNMTVDYVDSAIKIMNEIEAKSTNKGLKSIQILVSFGVVTGILRYLSPKYFPVITWSTIAYVGGLILLAFIIDFVMKKLSKNKKYKMKFAERNDNI